MTLGTARKTALPTYQIVSILYCTLQESYRYSLQRENLKCVLRNVREYLLVVFLFCFLFFIYVFLLFSYNKKFV